LMSSGWSKLSVWTPDQITRPALVEGDAVDDTRGIAALQKVNALEPQRVDGGGLAQRLQEAAHPILDRRVERALHSRVEPVEVVQRRHAQQSRQAGADQIRPLAVTPGAGGRRAHHPGTGAVRRGRRRGGRQRSRPPAPALRR
jgi:hypothetical protein